MYRYTKLSLLAIAIAATGAVAYAAKGGKAKPASYVLHGATEHARQYRSLLTHARISSGTLPSVPVYDRTIFLRQRWARVPCTIHPRRHVLLTPPVARACPPERDSVSDGYRHRPVPAGWCHWPSVMPRVPAPAVGQRIQNAPATQEYPIASGRDRAPP